MSLFKTEQLECPKCQKRFPFVLHHSINTGVDPQGKGKVLDLSLFRYRCPHCGQTDLVCYPTLYHDPENAIMIQVLWREEDFGQPVNEELRKLIEVMGRKNYRRREVFGYWELAEKIRIFDAKLDDFAIALLKALHNTQNHGVQLLFSERTAEGLRFVQIKDGELSSDVVLFPESLYRTALQYAEQWRKPHEIYEFLRVDESYFADIVRRIR